jgi:hypothetical protein
VEGGVIWEDSAGRRDSSSALEHVAGTGDVVRENSERCVGCIVGHRRSEIWMRIIPLGPK